MKSIRHQILAAAVAGFAGFAADPVQAAGLFDTLFGLAAPPRAEAAPPITVTPSAEFGGTRLTVTLPTDDDTRGRSKTYCVRTCDGRFFPLDSRSGAAGELCRALCPAAETKVFHGSAIDHAVARDGTRYSRLPAAFAYRASLVEGCSCRHDGGAGLATIAPLADPTLKPGDIVMTADGPMTVRDSRKRTASAADAFAGGRQPAAPTRIAEEAGGSNGTTRTMLR